MHSQRSGVIGVIIGVVGVVKRALRLVGRIRVESIHPPTPHVSVLTLWSFSAAKRQGRNSPAGTKGSLDRSGTTTSSMAGPAAGHACRALQWLSGGKKEREGVGRRREGGGGKGGLQNQHTHTHTHTHTYTHIDTYTHTHTQQVQQAGQAKRRSSRTAPREMEKEEAVVTRRWRRSGSSEGTKRWFSGFCGSERGSSPKSRTTVMSLHTTAPFTLPLVGLGLWEGERGYVRRE